MSSQVITITFEGTLNAAPTHLDSIRVMNLTAGGDTTIYFPDNVLVLGTMGISEVSTPGPSMQALPNPIVGSTEVVLRSVRGAALITSHDVAGRELVARSANLNAGIQRIRVSCERPGVHLLTVVQGGVQSALRLTAMEGAGPASFELSIGGRRCTFVLEVLPLEYPFDPGIAYGSDVDQEANTFLTVTMAGQEWMAENLRVSSYANGDPIPNTTSSFSTGGWSYYNNDPQYEGPYGRLYNSRIQLINAIG